MFGGDPPHLRECGHTNTRGTQVRPVFSLTWLFSLQRKANYKLFESGSKHSWWEYTHSNKNFKNLRIPGSLRINELEPIWSHVLTHKHIPKSPKCILDKLKYLAIMALFVHYFWPSEVTWGICISKFIFGNFRISDKFRIEVAWYRGEHRSDACFLRILDEDS